MRQHAMGVRSARISQQRHCNAHCSIHVTERLWRSSQHSVPPAVPGTTDMLCCECLRHLHTESFSCTVSPIHMLLLCSLIAMLSCPITQAFNSLFRFIFCSSLWRFIAKLYSFMLYKTRVQCSSNFACLHAAGVYSAAAWQQAVFLG